MSREILFKAKRADNGEWVTGYYFKAGEKSMILSFFTNETGLYYGMYEIDLETVCQYTGLTDKNGNKIWENDIVKFPDCEMSTESGYGDCFINAGKVAYDTESMSYFFTDRITVDMSDIIIKEEVEVLGNIFDNPELLEESHE